MKLEDPFQLKKNISNDLIVERVVSVVFSPSGPGLPYDHRTPTRAVKELCFVLPPKPPTLKGKGSQAGEEGPQPKTAETATTPDSPCPDILCSGRHPWTQLQTRRAKTNAWHTADVQERRRGPTKAHLSSSESRGAGGGEKGWLVTRVPAGRILGFPQGNLVGAVYQQDRGHVGLQLSASSEPQG